MPLVYCPPVPASSFWAQYYTLSGNIYIQTLTPFRSFLSRCPRPNWSESAPKISRTRPTHPFLNVMLLTLKTASRLSHLLLIAWRPVFIARCLRPRLVVAELTFLRNLLVEAHEFQSRHRLRPIVISLQCQSLSNVITFPSIRRL